ncbi:histidine phosphatase family protein [Gracilibacillus oryzae]|uniref:Histidine phosphatase family protein n=1 Tax=Gracilibacillus oryzae TaxID=1672701 RepID=A0A7C8GSS9_9BACI|nr:histidine phosphatase family protein [Gracilibacillus oryzae]KAB8134705.1 histidine phosphatase family protein [Gracilibacillus oryzae]
MTTVCFVRHGETDWNAAKRIQGVTDIPLNEKGKRQARECRDYLQSENWDVLISSPLQRAKKTAEIINEVLQLPLYVMDDFIERSFGDAEGMTVAEREEKFPDGNYPNHETKEALEERVHKGMAKLLENHPEKRILLVAHGAVINTILSIYSNGEIGSGKTLLMNACLNNLEYAEEQWKIHNYNVIDHLTEGKKREHAEK